MKLYKIIEMSFSPSHLYFNKNLSQHLPVQTFHNSFITAFS